MSIDECTEASTSIEPASLRNCMTSMRNTHAFMLMTINRCIDYTKASKGLRLIPKHETIDLMETLELPLSCMRNMQHKIEIVLNNIPKTVCPFVITDKQWLQENILCLLSNAVKYSADGIVTLSVFTELRTVYDTAIQDSAKRQSGAVEAQQDSGLTFIRFEVEDMGIGMSEHAMTSLFNPFKQTQRLAGGTGLGLYSLAKRLEALHGFYGASGRRDGKQGSLFWISIPYKPDFEYAKLMRDTDLPGDLLLNKLESIRLKSNERSPSVLVSSMRKSMSKSVRFPDLADTIPDMNNPPIVESRSELPLSILLVDDSPTILKMSSMMLQRLGHTVITADNGAIAVKLVTERFVECSGKSFDVILMDLQMPVMDGLEATRRIRELECSARSSLIKHIIIGMSANSDHETSVNAYEVGVDAFLPKPFKLDSFLSTLNTLL